ncbi:MAG TPA: glycoside hydrolase family 3 C-terminal domain-containing protein [Anaerohalosphaeraceae bacterium]|nr:glycoside hydrolase family 3 C-terminal domain-containing protein [Anaerohalosphaeraceae bacterium]HPB93377.1 glycoside hydrolase family 3 C-terminal domain-containing protein [Anaerohalosphaeraceae bacterium]HRT23762.1 glycoside hydrolase family 3 C-terminal domain-containing protein [Anaerohalosphaeraceae bacterium]
MFEQRDNILKTESDACGYGRPLDGRGRFWKLAWGCLFFCSASVLYAAHRHWAPVTSERYWSQSVNWLEASKPTAGDFAWISDVSKPCIVNTAEQVENFSVGSNGTGRLIIVNGGVLTSTDWCGNGMGSGSSAGTVIVEAGGTLNCLEHFWTGHAVGDAGTTILNGGTIHVGHQLGLGWDGGTGYMYINSGTLTLANWTDQTISGNSVMDIREGEVIVNGDQTDRIARLVSKGAITAYHGSGTVMVDYGQTYPGKTVITAIPVLLNRPPTVDAGVMRNLLWQENASITMTAAIYDDDPNHLGELGVDYGQILWSCAEPGVVFSHPDAATTQVAFSSPGVYVLRCTATDDENQSGTGSTLVSWIEAGKPNFEERAARLVELLTLSEKVSLLDEGSPAISRLGIPSYIWANEALHGVTGPGIATVFPQAIALGSTWEPELVHEAAAVISTEARIKNLLHNKGLTYWSPTINLNRDPRWGRFEESYSEDPFLLSRFAVSFVKGMQGDDPVYLKTVSSPKHYIANNVEATRHTGSSDVDMRNLRELYLPAFRAAVQEAGAFSVMCAYNRVNGVPACANSWLLQEVLREEWGFGGYVVSDCDAIEDIYNGHFYAASGQEAAVLGISAGCDLNCGTMYQANLVQAVLEGKVEEAAIDRAAWRVLLARLKLGHFEPPPLVPYNSIDVNLLDGPAHRQAALKAAQRSIVLLKNDGLLPLDIHTVRSIAVIGPNADKIIFGGYSGMASDPVSPLRSIREKTAGYGIAVDYTPGCEISQTPEIIAIPSDYLIAAGSAVRGGLKGEYFNNMNRSGSPALTRIDAGVNFNWESGSPDAERIVPDGFSVRWTGKLVPPLTRLYTLSLTSDDGSRLYLDGALLIDNWGDHAERTVKAAILLEAGREYDVRIEYYENGGAAAAKFQWDFYQEQMDAAEALAASHEVAVLVVGTDTSTAHEGKDMDTLELPGFQEELIERVTHANPRTIVVLVNGNPVSIPWAQANCPAILETWYNGQAAGTALADVLFGDVNPGGKLPVTFYRSVDELPDMEDYDIIHGGRTYQYFSGEVLYPFGHGLSYTTFAYQELKVLPKEASEQGDLTVCVEIENTGMRSGDEVVQVYLRKVNPSILRPLKTLKAFQRIPLEAGQKGKLTFRIPIRESAYFDVNSDAFAVEPGLYEVQVGSSSSDIRLTESFTVSADGVLNPDIVQDGLINLLDLAELVNWWRQTDCLSREHCGGADLDLSNQVDLGDLAVLAESWLSN